MTAPARLRLSERVLSPLGMLMLAVLLAVAGACWSVHGPSAQPRGDAPVASALPDPGAALPPSSGLQLSAAVDHTVSASTTSRGMDAALVPQHMRLLAGSVLLTALPSGTEPYWIVILGLGLGLWGAAEGSRLRALCCGRRHATRAPPVHF
jgi:hypothetical protein